MYYTFVNAAEYCYFTYGSELIFGESNDEALIGFVCPHCGEPVYYEDYCEDTTTENWLCCPVCEEYFAD